MGNIIAIASIVLALFAAGCVAYVAWFVTSKENLPDGPDEPGRKVDD